MTSALPCCFPKKKIPEDIKQLRLRLERIASDHNCSPDLVSYRIKRLRLWDRSQATPAPDRRAPSAGALAATASSWQLCPPHSGCPNQFPSDHRSATASPPSQPARIVSAVSFLELALGVGAFEPLPRLFQLQAHPLRHFSLAERLDRAVLPGGARRSRTRPSDPFSPLEAPPSGSSALSSSLAASARRTLSSHAPPCLALAPSVLRQQRILCPLGQAGDIEFSHSTSAGIAAAPSDISRLLPALPSSRT